MNSHNSKNSYANSEIKVLPELGKHTVVFLRHGQTAWNKQNRFTGWTDIPLTENGIEESKRAGRLLKQKGFQFDICFTSYLNRTVQTFHYAAEELDALHIPIVKSWKLNQRHYGALQGLTKHETIKQHGHQIVQKWRKAYDFPPPSLHEHDERHPSKERKYKQVPFHELPLGEVPIQKTQSLKQTVERVMPFWQEVIVPEIRKGKRVLVVAHQNTLRGMVKIFDGMSEEGSITLISDFVQLSIHNATPLVYEFDSDMKKVRHYYITEAQSQKIESVTK